MMVRTFTGMRLVGLLVPAAFAVSMVVPEQGSLPLGIPEALGCSGTGAGPSGSVAPPEPAWTYLAPALADGSAAIPVATDGFVLFNGGYVGLSDEQALAGLKLVVSDQDGNQVPGTVARLGTSTQQFSWIATEPLTLGAHLTASFSALPVTDPSYASGKFTLDVVGPPPTLPTPSALFHGWTDIYVGSGAQVDCGAVMSTGCGGTYSPQVFTTYEAQRSEVMLSTDLAPTSGVAWEVTTSQSNSNPDGDLAYSQTALVTGPLSSSWPLGQLTFGLDVDQVCVTVTIKDLRTGKETSGDVCHAVEADRESWTPDLGLCTAPPSEATRELWCRARTALGQTCSPTPLDTTPPDGSTPNDATPSTAASNNESSGCQLTRRNAPNSAAFAVGLAALAFAVARRRARKTYWA
jgi:hypothetical protein